MSTECPITPEDVFRESADNPILRHCIEYWKYGHITWEEAMMTAAVYLARTISSVLPPEKPLPEKESPHD
jgi:hypothetical protein